MSTLKIKDGDGIDRYFQVIGSGTLLDPYLSVVPSYDLALANEEILKSDGDVVSFFVKAKRLAKFGRNDNMTNGVTAQVWTTGGLETLASANTIDEVVSTDVGDVQEITIEGHTISGTELTFVIQTVTLNGTTPVTLPTPLRDVTRLVNNSSSDFAGTITVEDTTEATTHLTLLGASGQNQSKKCATSISNEDYFVIEQVDGGVVGGTSATIRFELQVRDEGKVWRTILEFNTDDFRTVPLNPAIIIKPNTDIRMVGTSTANNVEGVSAFRGRLASKQ